MSAIASRFQLESILMTAEITWSSSQTSFSGQLLLIKFSDIFLLSILYSHERLDWSSFILYYKQSSPPFHWSSLSVRFLISDKVSGCHFSCLDHHIIHFNWRQIVAISVRYTSLTIFTAFLVIVRINIHSSFFLNSD